MSNMFTVQPLMYSHLRSHLTVMVSADKQHTALRTIEFGGIKQQVKCTYLHMYEEHFDTLNVNHSYYLLNLVYNDFIFTSI